MYETVITEPVFGATLTVLYGKREDIDASLESKFPGAEGLEPSESGCTQRLVERESSLTQYVILVAATPSLANMAATLAHECLHVAIFILRQAGVKWDDEELLCYYSEFFFRKAYGDLLEWYLKRVDNDKQKDTKCKRENKV